MSDDKIQNAHTYFSTVCFNKCWGYIDKSDRSPEDIEEMLLMAQASLWHWKQRIDAAPTNLSVGYWQVSRVYALAGMYEMARFFGDKCLKISQDNALPPFYTGYAYETIARAELLRANKDRAKELLSKARRELERIEDKDERQLFEPDIIALEKSL